MREQLYNLVKWNCYLLDGFKINHWNSNEFWLTIDGKKYFFHEFMDLIGDTPFFIQVQQFEISFDGIHLEEKELELLTEKVVAIIETEKSKPATVLSKKEKNEWRLHVHQIGCIERATIDYQERIAMEL